LSAAMTGHAIFHGKLSKFEPPINLPRWFLAQGIHEKGTCVSRPIMEDPAAVGGEKDKFRRALLLT